MICQLCKKKKAVLHSYCISNNRLSDIHYCEECGQKQPEASGDFFNGKLQNLLEGLLKTEKSEKYVIVDRKCDICGTSLKDIRKHRFFGCPNCYEQFSDILDIKDTVYNKSSSPENVSDQIEVLQSELKEAVQLEDFEKAATIRDRIRNCEREGFLSDN